VRSRQMVFAGGRPNASGSRRAPPSTTENPRVPHSAADGHRQQQWPQSGRRAHRSYGRKWPDSRRVRADSVAGTSITVWPWQTSCSSQQSAQTVAVFHCTDPLRPLVGPGQQSVGLPTIGRKCVAARAMASSASSTTAVCERLCGSTPMITMPPGLLRRLVLNDSRGRRS
jgi:hypothetical protein